MEIDMMFCVLFMFMLGGVALGAVQCYYKITDDNSNEKIRHREKRGL